MSNLLRIAWLVCFAAPLTLMYAAGDDLLRAAEEHFRAGRFQEAAAVFQKASVSHPRDSAIGIARCQIELGSLREAFQNLDAVLTGNPEDRDARRAVGHVLVEANQFFRAEGILRPLVAADPGDKESWYYLAILFYRNGYYKAALDALDRSAGDAAANPVRRSRTQVYRAVCLDRTGRSAEAEAAFKSLEQQAATRADLDLLLVHAELLLETGRPERALELAERAVREHPHSGLAYYWRGRILAALGRLTPASNAAEEAVRLLPQLPQAHSLLLRIYQRQGRLDAAAGEAAWLREFDERKTMPR